MLFSAARAKSLLFSFFISIQLVTPIFAAEVPLELAATVDLRDASGRMTFFELMTDRRSGIKPALDRDYLETVNIGDPREFRGEAANFAHIDKLLDKVRGGMGGMARLLDELSGQKIPTNRMYATLMRKFHQLDLFVSGDSRQQSRLVGALVPVVGMVYGKGLVLILDDETYTYHYGYAVGSGGANLELDQEFRKTGRSYGAAGIRSAYDPSDNDYLRLLASYVANASQAELKRFYTVLFEILLKSDGSGLRGLNADGQLVIADFIAIYVAELNRHLMTGLKMYEWENALTEITMLAAFSVQPDGLTLDPRGDVNNESRRDLIRAGKVEPRQRLLGYFGVGTQGSGLDGRNKQRRHKLTRHITKIQYRIHGRTVDRIARLIDATKPVSDVYDDVMEFINNYHTQERVAERSDELIATMVAFVLQTRSDAQEISAMNN